LRALVEEQANRIVEQTTLIEAQATLIEKMRAEMTVLLARLSSNSRTSSKPPSSDGYAKPDPKSRRVRSGLKPGKQPGDPGHHLAQRLDPDVTVLHAPTSCRHCGDDLTNAEIIETLTRQVFELPAMALFCTEHQAQRKRCSCGTLTTGEFPSDATAPACYGPALRAYVCYLVTRQHLPIARVAELLHDTYAASVSTGAIVAMVAEGAGLLDGFLSEVQTQLRTSSVVHADETGLRVNARLAWVHAVSTTDLTLYHLDTRRGTTAMDAMGVLQHLTGVLVHDGWAPYRHYDQVRHQLCCAHLVRELAAAALNGGQTWANDMAGLLSDAWHLVLATKDSGEQHLDHKELVSIRANYRAIIDAGHEANPPPVPTGRRGRPQRSKAHNLLERLDLHVDDVLRFTTDFSIPFDNNLCERDIRMVKIAQKISGGFRSFEGAESFLAFRSYLSSAAKQGANRLGVLQQLFAGDTWMPSPSGTSP
jgi:transposase